MNKNYFNDLREWRTKRNLSEISREVFVKQILEELFELYGLSKMSIKSLTEHSYKEFFSNFKGLDVEDSVLIDGASDISVFANNYKELKGYDAEKCMFETLKEIDSRVQDPTQKKEWELNGANGKWQKDKNQEESTLYSADYSKCKLK